MSEQEEVEKLEREFSVVTEGNNLSWCDWDEYYKAREGREMINTKKVAIRNKNTMRKHESNT